jgi:DNA helicase II / ATP-dependent DNA helicase PcrA
MSLDLTILNPEQRKAVEELEGPCLIIAGAGSGKTRVLTYKIANLIESGINPRDILALTFTNKAANEMKERVSNLLKLDSNHLWMGTFHSIFARLLRLEAEKIGFTRNYTIYDTTDSANLVKNIMKQNSISTDKTNPKGINSAISKLKNKFILPEDFSASAKNHYEKLVSEIYPEYQSMLHKNNSLDFDDLLIKPIELFERYPEILEKYQDKFKFILVDEYQDTNRAQYILIKMLSQKHNNISVVGDDAQSIYKWRGAEIQNIFDFETDFAGHKIFHLEQNYRSTKKILQFAGFIIKKNSRQIEKNLWTENNDGEQIHIIENLTDKDESSKIAKLISTEIHKRKLKFKDFAILYRTNAQSRIFEEYLRQNGIPYIIIGGTRFYNRKEIKDILANLKIILNPKDNESFLRVLELKEGIGKVTIERLLSLSGEKELQIFDVIKNIDIYDVFTARLKNILMGVLNFIYKYQYLKSDISISEIVRGVIDEMGMIRELRQENTNESEERINNIKELISAVADFENSNPDASLESFLAQVSLVSDIDEVEDKKNAVTLMTIHAAKGLEFPVVFVCGLEENLFPVTGALNSEEEMEEERRLFYVAVTRAKEKLYLSFANQRLKYGLQSFQIRSRFLREIENEINQSGIVCYEGIKSIQSKKFISKDFRKSKSIALDYDYFHKDSNRFDDSGNVDDDFSDITKGISVYHDYFGKGIVLSVTGKGKDKKADIHFENIGIKKIILKYAKMRVETR